MLAIVSALWPVFALVLLGYLARRWRFPSADLWPAVERGTYFVLFPTLLVYKLALADLAAVHWAGVGLATVALVCGGALLCLALRFWPALDGAAFSSLFQGAIRFNTYVGLAATTALFGDAGLAIAAVIIALMIPMLNLFCVLLFSLVGPQRPGWRAILGALVRNPLIIACLLGIGLNLAGLGLPAPLASVMELLSRMALPLGLLAVGAGLSVRALHQARSRVLLASLFKLLLMPLLALLLAKMLSLAPLEGRLLLLFAALPTAPSAYILARQMGGDAPLMAAIITAQTLLSMLTLPLAMQWLGSWLPVV
ncbi:AEC family transporter [Marinobacterium arenosum]|uniref:AEC family transporter n=1 Tax=Marinobacterium arenosum TaxID=2862496 RepID=UPI001C94A89D|nr:AEC family transporter [Marinobacterium arenosum]MBY4676905.1 AEC family transporter [Marinobacterium arenosum]